MNTRTNLIIAFAGLLLGIVSTTPSADAQNYLVNPGFESGPGSLSTYVSVLTGGPPATSHFNLGVWGAENGSIETGPDNGVSPHTDKYMLKMNAPNTGDDTQTFQVTSAVPFVGEQPTLSAFFAAPISATAFVSMWYFPTGTVWGDSVPYYEGNLVLSSAGTWEQASLTGPVVPAGTAFIVSQVAYVNSSLAVPGTTDTFYPGFVDDTSLTVVPEPSTLALLGIGAIGLIGYAWRRRAARA